MVILHLKKYLQSGGQSVYELHDLAVLVGYAMLTGSGQDIVRIEPFLSAEPQSMNIPYLRVCLPSSGQIAYDLHDLDILEDLRYRLSQVRTQLELDSFCRELSILRLLWLLE